MYQLVQKFKIVKDALNSLNNGRYQHLSMQVDDNLQELQNLQFLSL